MFTSKNKDKKYSANELSNFCYQLSLIYKAGIPLIEGLTLISEELESGKLKDSIYDAIGDISEGNYFYAALERRNIFPDYVIKMIKIGEVSGCLDETMTYLSEYYTKLDSINRKLQTAITYPIILLTLMLGIILALIMKVIPMFNDILLSVGAELPAVTSIMLNVSMGLKNNLLLIVAIMLFVITLIFLYFGTVQGKKRLDEYKITMPIFKDFFIKVYAAKFSLAVSMLLKSGISYQEALFLVEDVFENGYLTEKIRGCRVMIDNGNDAADAFNSIGIFPRLFVRMFNVGYKTGELDSTMKKVSDIYDIEVEKALSKMTTSIEPVLIVVLSIIIGIILLTVMLPLISIMSSIG